MTSVPPMYDQQRGISTRSLISDQKPTNPNSSAPHPNDDSKAPTQGRPTNHYEQAVAAASQSKSSEGDSGEKPGLDRQQSWKMSDLKREHAEKMLNGQPSGQGYSSKQ